jgi:hypothetical protein
VIGSLLDPVYFIHPLFVESCGYSTVILGDLIRRRLGVNHHPHSRGEGQCAGTKMLTTLTGSALWSLGD